MLIKEVYWIAQNQVLEEELFLGHGNTDGMMICDKDFAMCSHFSMYFPCIFMLNMCKRTFAFCLK